jgi:hypothetical protein
MKSGDLVRWTANWITSRDETEDGIPYAKQVGICLEGFGNRQAYKIYWSDGRTRLVHCDYFEAL